MGKNNRAARGTSVAAVEAKPDRDPEVAKRIEEAIQSISDELERVEPDDFIEILKGIVEPERLFAIQLELVKVDFIPHAQDPLLTRTEAGALIGKSREYIRRKIDDGDLEVEQIAGDMGRVRRSAVLKMWHASYGPVATARKNERINRLAAQRAQDAKEIAEQVAQYDPSKRTFYQDQQ